MFEKVKSKAEIIAEKLASMSDERIKDMMEDPMGSITTTDELEKTVWAGMSVEEIKEAARTVAEKRGI